jgi:hypothetical protein
MKSNIRGFRSLALGLCVAAGALAAPAAFARSHVSVGVALPGVSVGYNSGWHGHNNYYVGVGGYGRPYYNGYYGGYYGGYYPGYYAPAPVYYSRPYGSCYSGSFYDARGYYHPGHRYPC